MPEMVAGGGARQNSGSQAKGCHCEEAAGQACPREGGGSNLRLPTLRLLRYARNDMRGVCHDLVVYPVNGSVVVVGCNEDG